MSTEHDNNIECLPTEVLSDAFSHLKIQDLVSLRQCCIAAHTAIDTWLAETHCEDVVRHASYCVSSLPAASENNNNYGQEEQRSEAKSKNQKNSSHKKSKIKVSPLALPSEFQFTKRKPMSLHRQRLLASKHNRYGEDEQHHYDSGEKTATSTAFFRRGIHLDQVSFNKKVFHNEKQFARFLQATDSSAYLLHCILVNKHEVYLDASLDATSILIQQSVIYNLPEAEEYPDLVSLAINRSDSLTYTLFVELSSKCKNISQFDLSWCYHVNDRFVRYIADHYAAGGNCGGLEEFIISDTVDVSQRVDNEITDASLIYLANVIEKFQDEEEEQNENEKNENENENSNKEGKRGGGSADNATTTATSIAHHHHRHNSSGRRRKFRALEISNVGNEVTDECLLAISKQCGKYLERLVLSDTGGNLTDVGMLSVAKNCPRLRVLDVWGTAGCIADQSMMEIAKRCPSLHYLDVRGTEGAITDATILCVAKNCKYLSFLNVGETEGAITDVSIVEVIQSCPHLHSLIVRGTLGKITDISILALANALMSSPSTNSMNVCRGVVAPHCPLQYLDVSYTCKKITDAGMVPLLQSILVNPDGEVALRGLLMGGTFGAISDQTLRILLDMVKKEEKEVEKEEQEGGKEGKDDEEERKNLLTEKNVGSAATLAANNEGEQGEGEAYAGGLEVLDISFSEFSFSVSLVEEILVNLSILKWMTTTTRSQYQHHQQHHHSVYYRGLKALFAMEGLKGVQTEEETEEALQRIRKITTMTSSTGTSARSGKNDQNSSSMPRRVDDDDDDEFEECEVHL